MKSSTRRKIVDTVGLLLFTAAVAFWTEGVVDMNGESLKAGTACLVLLFLLAMGRIIAGIWKT